MAAKKDGWVLASERLPTDKEAGGFGAVEVIVQCNPQSGGDPWQVMRIAKCVFIGGNKDRTLWITSDKPNDPIENQSWFVSHWRPFPKFPEPIVGGFRGY